MTLASTASLPPGSRLAGNALQITQPFTFDGWDFEGLEVFADADVTFIRPRFHNAVNAHFLHVGENGTAPKVNVILGDFDASDLRGDAGEAAVQIATGTLNTEGVTWRNGVRDYVSKFSGKWTAKGDRFSLAGLGMGADSHEDGVIHDYGGEMVMDGCFVDFRLIGQPPSKAGWTAMMYAQAKNHPIDWRIRNTPMLGAVDLGLLYTIQTNERAFGVSLDIRGCPIEPGIHGLVVGDTPGVGGKVRKTGVGNINALTGGALTP